MTVKIYTYVDERNKKAVKCCQDLLNCDDIEEDRENPEYIVVFSGDGCFAHAHRELYQLNVPFIGVGFGTRNFMLNRSLKDPHVLAEALKSKKWEFVRSQALSAQMHHKNGDVKSVMAFQDICFRAQRYEMLHMNISGSKSFKGSPYFCHADGVVIANAAGSTGYYYSLTGNVLLDLESSTWAFAAINPRIRQSFNIPFQDVTIELKRSMGKVAADNTVFPDVRKVIVRPGNAIIEILFHPDEDFAGRRYNELV